MARSYARNAFASRLFDGIAHDYQGPARWFSLLQYHRWHRSLVSKLELSPQSRVLDVCTGPGSIAMRIASQSGCEVVGLDLSPLMVRQARLNVQAKNLESRVGLVRGLAESLPFADQSFDVVVFSFLFRYVENPEATLGELVRVLRPGGQLASLEFYVPPGRLLHLLWLLHTHMVMPLASRLFSPAWAAVGSFLGPSISDFYRNYPLPQLCQMWRRSGITDVQTNVLSLGGGVVTWGRKENESEDENETGILRPVPG